MGKNKTRGSSIRKSLTYKGGKEKMEKIVSNNSQVYPSFVRCVVDDKEALLNVLKLPYRH